MEMSYFFNEEEKNKLSWFWLHDGDIEIGYVRKDGPNDKIEKDEAQLCVYYEISPSYSSWKLVSIFISFNILLLFFKFFQKLKM